MKTKQDGTRLSFELPGEDSAMRLAQQIADACGGTVTVSDDIGDDVGRAKPQSIGQSSSAIIASA